jgi:HK97 family phage major capsid protein
MKKEDILSAITDETQKKSVEQFLSFAEAKAKEAEMTAEKFKTMLDTEMKSLEIEMSKVKGLETLTDELGKQVKALSEKGGNPAKVKDFSEILQENMSKMDTEMSGMGGKFTLTVPLKSLGISQKATVLPASFTSDYAGARIPGFGQLATKKQKVAGLFSQFPIGADSHGIIYYTDWTTATRNAASRSVGSAAAESVAAFTGYSQALECISDSIPIAKEMLTRYSQLEAEIRNFISNNLMLKEDSLLVTGTGSTPEIKGIYTYATAFVSSTYAGFKPKKATLFDLIAVMTTEVEKSTQYTVDYCLVNSADMLGITLEKDANGNRINFNMVQADGTIKVKSVIVIETASVTANTLVLGDFTRARRYLGENISLEFGYNASGDFTKRIVTLLGNMEELLLVRACEADAFLKSTDITTDVANITAPSA